MITVLGIKIIDRIKEAGLTQGILSRHAGVITTRLGFHEVTDSVCSREAYILLHINGSEEDKEKLSEEISTLGGVEIRSMTFSLDKEELNNDSQTDRIEIIGILAERERNVVSDLQKVLTAYGCSIRSRLGVNEVFFGLPAGLIILELTGDYSQRLLLEKELKTLNRVHVRTMAF
jgi:hypothetical protein